MATSRTPAWIAAGLLSLGLAGAAAGADEADLILHHGKVVTVDRDFTIRQALAVKGDRLLRVGTDEEVLATRGPGTKVVDLKGRMVLPGLIDSHTHPSWASLAEFDHEIPGMETIRDVLDHIRSRAEALGPGKWIVIRQVFITRLKERRYPTRDELDKAAPENPVLFSTGPDASLNTRALKLSGIDKDFRPEGPGKFEADPATGEPTGILRNLTRYVKAVDPGRQPSEADRGRRLTELFADYNSAGITAIIDRDADPEAIDRYGRLHEAGALTVRVGISHGVGNLGPLDGAIQEIRRIATHPLRKGLGRNKVYNWPPPSIIGLWTPIRNWNANSSRSSPASTRGSVASLLPPRPEPSATAGSAASAGPPAFLVSRSRGRWRSWIPRVRTPTESAVPGAAARSSVTPRRNCSRPWRS